MYEIVRDILNRVKQEGGSAVVELTNRFDHRSASSFSELELPQSVLEQAWRSLNSSQSKALQMAAERIQKYAEQQKLESWDFSEKNGTVLWQRVTPISRVGVYVPGGKAAYPSSVLMNVLPARVAGVSEIVMVVPAPKGELNTLVLAAAYLAGVHRVFTIGGAQAIAALAYGTDCLPAVDKIVGPGNIYVATAKKLVFGQCGIDMVAGPSEILIITDGTTNPDWLAMDLFAQAEHDEHAQAILIGIKQEHLDQVLQSIEKLLPTMERKNVIEASLNKRGGFILTESLDKAVDIANKIAPEHLELSVTNPKQWLDRVNNAGAIFLGSHTSEAIGDYCAGPNHVLPTGASARYSSPLGVYDFQKRTSIIYCSTIGASELGSVSSVLARGEGLTAHARSAEFRISDID